MLSLNPFNSFCIKNIKLYKLLVLCLFSPLMTYGQGGIIARQLFKPGVKIGGEAIYEGLLQGEQVLGFYSAKTNVTIPVKSKFKVKLAPGELLKLSNLWELRKIGKLKTFPKFIGSMIQPKAHQIFWNFNTQYTIMYGKDYIIENSDEPTDQISGLMKVSTGVTGLHYMKGMQAFFYSGDLGFMEDMGSVSRMQPIVSVMGGYAKIKNPFLMYYSGLFLNYNNGRVLPIPFVGIDLRVANKARLNLTMPFQAKVSFKVNKEKRYALLVQYNGFASGFTPDYQLIDHNQRYNFTNTYVKATGILERKISRNLKIFMETGWVGIRRFNEYDRSGNEITRTLKLKSSPYAYISIYHTFGKSLFNSSIGNMLNL